MSDRIGVMRTGNLIQVGTPNEIYTAPTSKFVSEFMGDVNIMAVRAGADGKLRSDDFDREFVSPPLPPDFSRGYLVVRPEFMRFINRPEEAENALVGRVYNEYALGSRIQYQVRVGDHVFVIEKLRQQAFTGKLDDEAMIGWDSGESILVVE